MTKPQSLLNIISELTKILEGAILSLSLNFGHKIMETYTVKVYENGNRYWYQNDKLHRVDGPAIEYENGTREWYQNGKLHRVDGPAVEWANGYRSWYQNGKKHRVDGPAIEYPDGNRLWYIYGNKLSEEEFNKQTQKSTCENRTVIIDGITYQLVKIQ